MLIDDIYANTSGQYFGVRDFIVTEVAGGWEWCHEDRHDLSGTCPTLFKALEAAHAAAEQMLSDKLDAMSGGKP